MYKNSPINIPLLSALLRISDEFDLSFNRVQEITYHNIDFDNSISEEEWLTHLSISGIAPSPENSTLLVGSAKCKNHKIHRKLKNIETKINIQLDDLSDHLHHYRELKNELPKKFRLDIEPEGYKVYDFKFSLQEREIIRMLMGEKLYRRKEESIRELIKNSVDACHLKREILKQKQMNFKPTIQFKVGCDKNSIEISDNGIGMDEEIIESYFTKIGKSFYKSTEFLNQQLKFTPVSELGIGFLSCFMIAEKIIVETKMENKQGLLMEIDDLSDYFLIRDSTKSDPGTTITLSIRNDSRGINFFDEVKTFASHLDINIDFFHEDNRKSVITDEGYKNHFSKYLGEYSKYYDVKEIEIKSDFIDGTIGVIYLKSGPKLLVQLPFRVYGEEINKFISSLKNKNITSFEGIFVNNEKNIVPMWLEVDFCNLNIKKDVIDLNVARNDFILNEKFYKFIDNFEKLIIREIKNVIKQELKTLNYSEINEKRQISSFVGNSLNWYKYREDWIEKGRSPSKNLANWLKSDRYHWVVVNTEIMFLSANEIKSLNTEIYSVGYQFDNIIYLKYLVENCLSLPKKGVYGTFFHYGVLDDAKELTLFDYFDIEKFKTLKEFLPSNWFVGRFKNYKTTRFFELIHYQKTVVNRDHPFVDLIINNLEILSPDNKIALEGFFKGIKVDAKRDLNLVLDKQKKILKWYLKKNVISNGDIPTFMLTVDDFPPNYIKNFKK
jgi:hypothetical protein